MNMTISNIYEAPLNPPNNNAQIENFPKIPANITIDTYDPETGTKVSRNYTLTNASPSLNKNLTITLLCKKTLEYMNLENHYVYISDYDQQPFKTILYNEKLYQTDSVQGDKILLISINHLSLNKEDNVEKKQKIAKKPIFYCFNTRRGNFGFTDDHILKWIGGDHKKIDLSLDETSTTCCKCQFSPQNEEEKLHKLGSMYQVCSNCSHLFKSFVISGYYFSPSRKTSNQNFGSSSRNSEKFGMQNSRSSTKVSDQRVLKRSIDTREVYKAPENKRNRDNSQISGNLGFNYSIPGSHKFGSPNLSQTQFHSSFENPSLSFCDENGQLIYVNPEEVVFLNGEYYLLERNQSNTSSMEKIPASPTQNFNSSLSYLSHMNGEIEDENPPENTTQQTSQTIYK